MNLYCMQRNQRYLEDNNNSNETTVTIIFFHGVLGSAHWVMPVDSSAGGDWQR